MYFSKTLMAIATLFLLISPAQASMNLGQVLQASPAISEFKNSKSPLQFQEPIKFNIKGKDYTLRFFTFKNTADPQATFADTIANAKKLHQRFKTATEAPQALFISSSDSMFKEPSELEKRGIHYILSIEPSNGMPEQMPTTEEVVKATPAISNFKSSPLAYPADEKSIITLDGKKYQIRYFLFETSQPTQTSFAKFVESENLAETKAQLMDHGYGALYVFRPSDDMKKRGVKFMLSLGEVKE